MNMSNLLSSAVEAVEAAQLETRATLYTACESSICRIWTPHQSGDLVQHVDALIDPGDACAPSLASQVCKYACLVLDEELSR